MIAAEEEERGCIVFRCNKSDFIWPAEWNCITQADIRLEALLLLVLVLHILPLQTRHNTNNVIESILLST